MLLIYFNVQIEGKRAKGPSFIATVAPGGWHSNRWR